MSLFETLGECLNPANLETGKKITYHREPTTAEIKFGEGATHYKEFDKVDVRKPNGELKKWVKCPYDGLRYNY